MIRVPVGFMAHFDPITEWKRGRSYRCPVCSSDQVARELNRTTRYPGAEVAVERLIRCMDCGAEDEL